MPKWVRGERGGYPGSEACPPSYAVPPPVAYWAPPAMDPRYSGDGRMLPFGVSMPPKGPIPPLQAPY